MLEFRIKSANQIRCKGSGRWARSGDSWLATHDAFHHVSGDTGTVAEELMTFGVELWMKYPSAGVLGVSWSNVAGTLMKEVEDGLDGKALLVGPHGESIKEESAVPADVRARLVELSRRGLEEFVEWNDRNSYMGKAKRKALSADLLRTSNVVRYAGWMAMGWMRGKTMYPHPAEAEKAFEQVEELLRVAGSLGLKSIRMEIDEADGEVRPVGRNGGRTKAMCCLRG